MDERERYFWDLTGYLVVQQVLTADELAAANAALDDCHERGAVHDAGEISGPRGSRRLRGSSYLRITASEELLTLPKPHCEPFRRMLAHPAVVSRLNEMCGTGFRFDHGPHYIGGVEGTAGMVMHGAGEPHRPYVAYHHQGGRGYCAGVTVAWNLADAGPGDGGFACVPGSHKAGFPMPRGVRTADDDMGLVKQPEVRAGDVLFFMDGAQTHGTLPWAAGHDRRSVLFKYAGRTATRTGRSAQLAPPQIHWGEDLVAGMSDVERAVMYGPASAPGTDQVFLTVDEDGTVRVG